MTGIVQSAEHSLHTSSLAAAEQALNRVIYETDDPPFSAQRYVLNSILFFYRGVVRMRTNEDDVSCMCGVLDLADSGDCIFCERAYTQSWRRASLHYNGSSRKRRLIGVWSSVSNAVSTSYHFFKDWMKPAAINTEEE